MTAIRRAAGRRRARSRRRRPAAYAVRCRQPTGDPEPIEAHGCPGPVYLIGMAPRMLLSMPLHAITEVYGEAGPAGAVRAGAGVLPAGRPGAAGRGPRAGRPAARRRPPGPRAVPEPPAAGGHPDHPLLRRPRRRRAGRGAAARRRRGPPGGAGRARRRAPHDELTDAAVAELARRFNPRVAELVRSVTNPEYDPDRDRHEQYREHVGGQPGPRPVGPGHQGVRLHRQRGRRHPHHAGEGAPVGHQVPPARAEAARAGRPAGHPAVDRGQGAHPRSARPGRGEIRRHPGRVSLPRCMACLTDAWWRDAVIYQVYPALVRRPRRRRHGRPARHHRAPAAPAASSASTPSGCRRSIRRRSTTPGYDVADYRAVDPRFGNLGDADKLIAEAHALGLKVIVDLVPNHTSSEHAWFQAALAAAPGSPERERYIFRDGRGPDGDRAAELVAERLRRPAPGTGSPDGAVVPAPVRRHPARPELGQPRGPRRVRRHPAVLAGPRASTASGWTWRTAWSRRPTWPTGPAPSVILGGLDPDGPPPPMWDQEGVHEIYRQWRAVLDEYPGDRILVAEAWVQPAGAAGPLRPAGRDAPGVQLRVPGRAVDGRRRCAR